MSLDDRIRRTHEVLGNHRATAWILGLPLHVVMFSLGMMSADLYHTINGGSDGQS